MNNKLETISNLFEGNEIRSIWDAEKEEYYFSVVDVISALSDSKIPRNYWSDLKRRLINEGSQLHEKIVQLKLRSKKRWKEVNSIPEKRYERCFYFQINEKIYLIDSIERTINIVNEETFKRTIRI